MTLPPWKPSFARPSAHGPKGPAAKEEKIEFQPAKPGYYLVRKRRREPEFHPHGRSWASGATIPTITRYEVFNEAFGGGFSSRLMQSIRTAKGLAYAVGGGIGSAFDHPGTLRLSMGTKSATTVESIQALDEQIDDVTKHPISEDEIKRAKDSILNGFVFNLDSPDKILRERMAYEFYGYPADYLDRFRSGVEKVTPADVARAVSKYLHKDQLAVLVVGNTSEFDKPLSSLGAVTNIDIAIPPPPGEQPEPAAKPTQ